MRTLSKGGPVSDSTNLSRRDVIKRGLALGSVGYVAPLILGNATPASAQISGSGCSSATESCEEVVECLSGVDPECACAQTIEGPTACIQIGSNAPQDPDCCESSDECPSGWFCMNFEILQDCDFDPVCGTDPLQVCFPPCGVSGNPG
jgi:hypothetical protein